MSSSPLADLVQAIHLPSHRFLLTTSTNIESDSIIDLHLFAPTPISDGRRGSSSNGSSSDGSGSGSRSIITWRGEINLDAEEVEQGIWAEAIKKGYLHVDMPMTNKKILSKAETLDLKILPPDRDPSTFRLTSSDVPQAVPLLLEAAFELLARPAIVSDKTEIRSLRAQIAQKDEEIASLSAKLSSAKATVVRATASDNSKNKKHVLSPVKKAPANASALQPNAKRRRVVEDDFAGSDEE